MTEAAQLVVTRSVGEQHRGEVAPAGWFALPNSDGPLPAWETRHYCPAAGGELVRVRQSRNVDLGPSTN